MSATDSEQGEQGKIRYAVQGPLHRAAAPLATFVMKCCNLVSPLAPTAAASEMNRGQTTSHALNVNVSKLRAGAIRIHKVARL